MRLIFIIVLLFSISILACCQSLSFKKATFPMELQGSRGVSFGDIDQDGDLDLVLANELLGESGGNPIYYNKGGSPVFKIDTSLYNRKYWSEGVSLIDVDNDNDLDIFFATQFNMPNPLFLNDGHGAFIRTTLGDLAMDSTNSPGACWCDFDKDSDMDVFVVNRDGGDDNLYVNDGKGFFRRQQTGPWIGNKGDGRDCAWGDLNDDGFPDLYVVNFVQKENNKVVDSHRNFLYLNNGTSGFKESTKGIIVEEKNPSYGVAFVDYDYDQDIDVYVTNVSSRIGNALYRNDGKGNFEKQPTAEIGDFTNRPSKGQTWGDFNNDGYLDLYIGNGTEGYPEIQNYLFLSMSDGSFKCIYNVLPAIDAHISAGTASGDIDWDGDLDIYVCNWGGDGEPNDLYINETVNSNWIKFRLQGAESNSFGIGSWLLLETEEGKQTRYHYPQTGYGSQNSPEAHFGLGNATNVKSLEVIWPSGVRQRLQNLKGNKTYRIVESQKIEPVEK